MFHKNETKRLLALVDSKVAIGKLFDEEEQKAVKKTTNMERLKDQVIIPQHQRPKMTMTFIKLFTAELNFHSFMEDVVASLRAPYELRIGFSFIMYNAEQPSYVFAIAARPINHQYRIVRDQQDRDNLLKFLEGFSRADLLEYAFEQRNMRNPFENSGYRPGKLVTISAWITKLQNF